MVRVNKIGMPKQVRIVDTTLRDGEQTAGIVFSSEEKIKIAKMLSQAGIYQIEAGVPAIKGDEMKAIKEIVKAKTKSSILGWCRAVISDIEAAIECGLDAVCISMSSSDIHIKYKLSKTRKEIYDMLRRAINFAKTNNLYVSANAEDASRTDMGKMIEFAEVVRDAGADRLRFCDTVGILNPMQVYTRIKMLINKIHLPVEMHAHNDFGMATANSLAGIDAGAQFVSVTVNGIGERAGNAALEEVVMALKYTTNYDIEFDISKLKKLSDYVSLASGRPIGLNKPIVGQNIFFHEAGTQVKGVVKAPKTYEVFTPKEVGAQRQILIGKHSGRYAVISKFEEYGIKLTEAQAGVLLNEIREKATEVKRALFDKELMSIYYRLNKKV